MSELLLKISRLREQANIMESEYLQSRGWVYTCETPGRYLLWKKDLGAYDGMVLVDQKRAMLIQHDEDIA